MAQRDEFLQAITRFAPRVEGIARRYTNPITGKPLTGAQLLGKLIQGESGFRMDAVSSAGARGGGQFMPGTRQAVLQHTGGRVDPWRSPAEAVRAATLHLTGALGHREGLEGYNPGGGQSYVNYILGQRVDWPAGVRGGRTGGGGAQGGAGAPLAPVDGSGGVPALRIPERGSDGLAVLLATLGGQGPRPTSSLQPPAHSAQATLPAGARIPQGGGGPAPRPDIGALLELVRTAGGGVPQLDGSPVDAGGGRGGGAATGGAQGPRGGGGSDGPPTGRPVRIARAVDAWAADLGVPVTAKEEPGHAVGGDHDPAVKIATARDYGGSEAQRKRLFDRITRSLGIDNAVYKGSDINVTVNGVRWEIISRDHGTGPHLHVGWRRA